MIKKVLWLLLLVTVIAVVMFWLNREQWLKDFNQERQQRTTQLKQQGSAFAKQANQQQCLEQSFKQLGKCFQFDCTLDQGVFLKSCLTQAQPSSGFCDGVPEYREKVTEDDKQWLKDGCWDKNLNGEGCRFLYKQQIHFCSVSKKTKEQ